MAKWDPWHWPAFTSWLIQAVNSTHGSYCQVFSWFSCSHSVRWVPLEPVVCIRKKNRMTWKKNMFRFVECQPKTLHLSLLAGGLNPNYTVIRLFATRHWLPHSVGKNPTESRFSGGRLALVRCFFQWIDSSCWIFWGPTKVACSFPGTWAA